MRARGESDSMASLKGASRERSQRDIQRIEVGGQVRLEESPAAVHVNTVA